MTVLEDYFQRKVDESFDHPLLRVIDEMSKRPEVKRIAVEVWRQRDVLGFKPAMLYVHFVGDTGVDVRPFQKEDWDDALNSALVKRGIPALSNENEMERFSLGLRGELQTPETRFGDGFFNAVLVHHIVNSPFANHPRVKSILKDVYGNGVDPASQSYEECKSLIDTAIRGRAMELVENLNYGIPEAEDILAAAVARYLDERFSVSNRRIMGLL